MKTSLKAICLSLIAVNAQADVNLVKSIVAPSADEALKDAKGGLACEDGLVLQKNGYCCPEGTSNVWPYVCTPIGTIDDQIFNFNEIAHYCPSADMFIVSDKNLNWFSCADSRSTPLYATAKSSEMDNFCREHGYGLLIKIKPWGTAGCIKAGESQGDGCIEAGTCSFVVK
jgi:hypothetical protein